MLKTEHSDCWVFVVRWFVCFHKVLIQQKQRCAGLGPTSSTQTGRHWVQNTGLRENRQSVSQA